MKAVVTGGGGFLGRAIVERLRARGDEVTSVARGAYPELAHIGATHVRADLAADGDRAKLEMAVAGADVVHHVAAKAGVWGAREDFLRTNVKGTENVLAACRAAGVSRLVFTSSPSVCFDGTDHIRAKNDLPYATSFLAPYPESKAQAEALVLAANSQELATCALRPHLIFGPRDPHIIPRLLERARQGRLAVVGAGTNEVSLTYVDNAALAHVTAADALTPKAAHAGRAYFIGNEEPVLLWDWIGALLERVGIDPIRKRVPASVARGAGGLLEFLWRALRRPGEPPMTRFVAAQLATSHSYDLEPARSDFGYEEEVGLAEANERLVAWVLESQPE